ncbi:MAG: hypothetical protein GC165_18320 [Armatimonadetes bacterium]|nr:hypothetical protein [Armatimonadota bacterium]
MRGIALINAITVRRLDQAILATGSVSLVLGVFLLGSATINYFRKNEVEVRLAATAQAAEKLREMIDQSKHVRFGDLKESTSSYFQNTIDQTAAKNDCQLIEVTAAAEEGPYLSRYKTDADGKGWKQKGYQCQAIGSAENAVKFLRDLTSISAPVELQTIEIAPIDKELDGHQLVSIKFGVQVMRQEEGA